MTQNFVLIAATPAQVASILAQVGEPARSDRRVVYEDGRLVVPADIAAAFQAADPERPLPAAVPQKVELWQARAACKQTPGPSGVSLFVAIDAYIDSHRSDQPALWEAWNMGNTASRHGLFVGTLSPVFGMTDAQVDSLFVAADQIRA